MDVLTKLDKVTLDHGFVLPPHPFSGWEAHHLTELEKLLKDPVKAEPKAKPKAKAKQRATRTRKESKDSSSEEAETAKANKKLRK